MKEKIRPFFSPSWWLVCCLVIAMLAVGSVPIFVLPKGSVLNVLFSLVAGGIAAYLLACLIMKIIQFQKSIQVLQNQWLTIGLSLAVSLLSNLVYSLIMVGMGLYVQSPWYLTLALYHIVLAAQKSFLSYAFYKHRDNLLQAWRTYRFVACLILGLSLALIGTIVLVIYQKQQLNSGFHYALLMALYTFSILVVSLVNVVKARKLKHPLLLAARMVNLATSFFSVFTLQTIMLQTFNTDNSLDWTLSASITGLVIFVILNLIAVLMLNRARKEMKKMSQN